jgi:hypothetical protein
MALEHPEQMREHIFPGAGTYRNVLKALILEPAVKRGEIEKVMEKHDQEERGEDQQGALAAENRPGEQSQNADQDDGGEGSPPYGLQAFRPPG